MLAYAQDTNSSGEQGYGIRQTHGWFRPSALHAPR
jgi:hypothetical protein